MKYIVYSLLAGALLACSPNPALDSVALSGSGTMVPRHGRSDMGFDFDMGFHGRPDMGGGHNPDMPGPAAPCPFTPPGSTGFCYWLGGADSLDLSTALTLSSGGAGCTVMDGAVSVNAPATTCTAAFASTIPATWGFTTTKPIHLTFSYSMKTTVDSAALTVTMPAGTTNEVLNISAITGTQNQLGVLLSSAMAMSTPGFNLSLGGSATKASLTLSWISVWQ